MIATKEQERQALKKIKMLVDDLGDESYLGTAFKGCFEIAEQNIENDFGCSMAEVAEVEKERAEKSELKVAEALEALATEKKASEALREQIHILNTDLRNTQDTANHLHKLLEEQRQTSNSLNRRAACAEQVIIHLKAKLYDLTVK